MKPVQLGRMKVHKIYEMESPTPLLFQLPGVTADDLARLSRWYAQPDEITGDPETSFMTFAVHSWVIELDGLTITGDGWWWCFNEGGFQRSACGVCSLGLLRSVGSGVAPSDSCVVCVLFG